MVKRHSSNQPSHKMFKLTKRGMLLDHRIRLWRVKIQEAISKMKILIDRYKDFRKS